MIRKELIGEHTRMALDVKGDTVLLIHYPTDEEPTVLEIFRVEDFIEFGQSLTLNERADFSDQIKSDAITNAKLLRGDFNSL